MIKSMIKAVEKVQTETMVPVPVMEERQLLSRRQSAAQCTIMALILVLAMAKHSLPLPKQIEC